MTQDTHTASGTAIDRALDSFERRERGIPQARIAAELVAELRAALASAAAPAQQPGAAYAALSEERAAFERWNKDANQGYDLAPCTSGKLQTFESTETEHAWRGFFHGLRASHGQAPASKIEGLTAAQESLGVEFEKVLHDNLFDLYEESAPHGQAPAQAAPAAVAGPSGYGPKVTVKRRCSDCKACNSESYAVQGDSGHYVYCEHPSLPESKYIGNTHWDTPDWCPAAAPTTQPAPQADSVTAPAGGVEVDWERETDDPIAEMDAIFEVYKRSMGKPAPDAEMGRIVEKTRLMLMSWWGWHREDIRAALVAARATPPAQAADSVLEDAARLDWLESDVGCRVFHLGKSWYTRANFGMPYRKRASLREAIDAARKGKS